MKKVMLKITGKPHKNWENFFIIKKNSMRSEPNYERFEKKKFKKSIYWIFKF
jgi:hypothetical protein